MSSNRRRGRDAPERPWVPRTSLGREVAEGKITSMGEIAERGLKVKEPQIVRRLLPDLNQQVVEVGIVEKQTDAGPLRRYRAIVAVGNNGGWFGVGEGKAPERAAAIEKATSAAYVSVIPVQRAPEGSNLSIPFKMTGKVGSVTVELSPAEEGVGIVAGPTVKELLALAGIKNVYVKTFGRTRTKSSLAGALYEALRKSYAPNL
jgi:small subunit ribosomal protein S5